jgi:hypothetical protein
MIDSEQVCKGKVKRTVRIGDERDPEFLNWQEFQKECTFCIMGNQRLIYEWSVCVVKKVWNKTKKVFPPGWISFSGMSIY